MIHQFLEKYQSIPEYNNDMFMPYGDKTLNQTIYNKTEFHELKLDPIEIIDDKPGNLYKHQKFVSRYLSSNTLYDSILLFHEPGTGKTCSAISVIEQIFKEHSSINKALVIAKGQSLLDNFKNELLFKCTDGKYIPENYDELTERMQNIRTNKKLLENNYRFETFEVFSKSITNLTNETIEREFSNCVVVIDEIHNIRIKGFDTDEQRLNDEDERRLYDSFHRFLHTIKNSKVILMSGTPMKDAPEEIAAVMNLILPMDQQIPTENEFIKEFLEQKGEYYYLKKNKLDNLKDYFKGKISYLKAQQPLNITKKYVGETMKPLEHFIIDIDEMSDFQTESYIKAYRRDTEIKRSIYSQSRQASLFVFPDGSWGKQGFEKYIIEKPRKKEKDEEGKTYTFLLSKELEDELKGKNNKEKLEKLKKFSSKYHKTISQILNSKNKKVFVYNDLVKGSGIILFSLLLKHFDISYTLLSVETMYPKQIKEAINKYNSVDNVDGKKIQVILGSKVISEGFSFKNITEIHIETPFWNYPEIEQAIARGIRVGSHPIDKDVTINIYQHVSVPGNVEVPSLDFLMYKKSEIKDFSIKQIERLIKEVAVDCELNKDRNQRKLENDRECEYKTCNYTCWEVNEKDYIPDNVTYDLFYTFSKLNEIKNLLLTLFNKQFFVSFELIKKVVNDKIDNVDSFELLRTLTYIINNKIKIKSPYGFISYLSEKNNIYYLDSLRTFNGTITDISYEVNPIIKDKINFEDIENLFYVQDFDRKLKKLISEKNDKNKEIILRSFRLIDQENLLESSIKAEILELNKNINFRNWVIKYYSSYLQDIEEYKVSTLLYKQYKELRCLDTESEKDRLNWKNCDEEILEEIEERTKEKVKEVAIVIGYQGIIEKAKDTFKIKDLKTMKEMKIEEEDEGKKVDKRKEYRGQVCKTMKWKELFKVIDAIGLQIPEKDKDYLKNKDKSGVLEEADKKFLKEFTADELKKMNVDKLRNYIYWSKGARDKKLCPAIRGWFEEQDPDGSKGIIKFE